MTAAQDRWDAAERDYKAERDDAPAHQQAMEDAHTIGCALAQRGVTRQQLNRPLAALKTQGEHDALLGGYYAELRRLDANRN